MEENKLVLSVFAGIRISNKKKIYKWYNLDENESISGSMSFTKPIVPASVGGVYKTYQTDSTIVLGGEQAPKYFKRFENKKAITEWAIEDETAKQQLALKSLNTKAAKIKPLDEALADIEKMSRDLNRNEKLALIAKISEVILRS